MRGPTITSAAVLRRAATGSGGFLARLNVYLREMYPPVPRIAFAGLLSASVLALCSSIHHVPYVWSGLHAAVATAGIFLFLLVLRLMDELKDLDVDRELFAERPVPSGRVRVMDIVVALVVCSVAFLAVNARSPAARPIAVAVLAYAYLMFRYFFAPDRLRRVLLLNLLTHNPVVPLLLLWVVAVFADQQHRTLTDLDWRTLLVVLGGYWAALLAWEIARKIRASEEETAYVTYSQVLGRKTAALVALGLQSATLVAVLHLQRSLDLSVASTIVLCAALASTIVATTRFLARPSPRTSRWLRPCAESYVLVLFVAVILGVTLH